MGWENARDRQLAHLPAGAPIYRRRAVCWRKCHGGCAAEGGQVRTEHSHADCSGPEGAAREKELAGEWYQLDFSIARSLRYHAKRRSFFQRCNQLTRALIAITSAGAIAAFVADNAGGAVVVLGVIVGLATALDLVFDYSQRAMDYDGLYRRFADLNIRWASVDRTLENYRLLTVERLIIEKEEPTVLAVLNVICCNEELKARDFDFHYKVGQWQKMFCEVIDLWPSRCIRVPQPA
jgi:hypothetical protein